MYVFCLQSAKAPDASEFPQLSSESPPAQPAKPVWPRITESKPAAKKQSAAAAGWGSSSAAGSQSGWSAQGSRVSEVWDDGPNWVPTYDQPTAGELSWLVCAALSEQQSGL